MAATKNILLLGQVTALAMNSAVHRPWTLADFDRLMVPPLALGQYYAFHGEAGGLNAFVTWANLTGEAEAGYLARTRKLQSKDWNAGDYSRLWLIDCFASNGDILRVTRHITRDLRAKAERNGWPATRACWARSHGTGKVQHIGSVAR